MASNGARFTGVAIFLMCCWAVERPLLARSVTTLALAFLQTELTLNRMLLYIDPTALNPYNSSSAFLRGSQQRSALLLALLAPSLQLVCGALCWPG